MLPNYWMSPETNSINRLGMLNIEHFETQSAMIPRKPPTLLKPCTPPVVRLKTSRLIILPRSEFPSGESMSRKRSAEKSPEKNTTAPIVPRKSVGRRSLRSSAKATFHIIFHLSFQRKFLQDLVVVALVATK